jgi:hypothetical protein
VPPTEITATTDDKKSIKIRNPEYKIWVAQDQQVLSYLLNSVTREILGYLATKVTAASAWTALEELFASQSRAKVTNLRFALTNTKKGSMTIPQYFTKIKGFADELTAYGKTLDDEEIVSYILNGLDSDYTPLVSSVMFRLEPISVNELYAQALGFESRQTMLHEADQQYLSSTNLAMRGRGRGRSNSRGGRSGFFGRSRDRGHAQGVPNQRKDDRLRCQICKKPNHEASECWHKFDEEYQVEEKYAAVATPAYGVDTNWYTDTRATYHVTGELNKLTTRDRYQGHDQVHAANGTGMKISHVGNSSIYSPIQSLQLNNVLRVPSATMSLCSVHKISRDNNVFFEYHPY